MNEGTLGLRIKAAREEAGLSREALAASAEITFPALDRMEKGYTRSFKPEVIVAIANATGKTPGWFFEGMAAVAAAGVLG